MKMLSKMVLAFVAVLALGGCVVYEPYPYPSGPSAFDRSWNAAAGALHDQGVEITTQDRASGMIEGRRGSVGVKARVVTQADGRVRVEFNTTGTSADPGLPERISRSYDARMGR